MSEADRKRLAELEMREAARAAIYQYGLAVDAKDFGLLREIFTEDIVFDRPPADIKHGREAAMAHYESFLGQDIGNLKHFITNAVITTTGDDTMAAQAYVFALSHHKSALSLVWGQYRIGIRMEDGAARIAELGIYLDKPLAPVRSMLGSD